MITIIRKEKLDDLSDISKVIKSAFQNVEISNKDEHFMVERLRKQNAMLLSLVATIDNKIVGHISFSQVEISDKSKDWYALAPISVLPSYQKNGIGKALILDGLSHLKSLGASGCVLVGFPSFYKKFGFKNNIENLLVKGIPKQYFMVLNMSDDSLPSGELNFHSAFSNKK